jgi:hypothetical protein
MEEIEQPKSLMDRLEDEAQQPIRVSAFINHVMLYCEDNDISSKAIELIPSEGSIQIALNSNVISNQCIDEITDMAEQFERGELFGYEWLEENS